MEIKIGNITFYGTCPLYSTCLSIINKCAKTGDAADVELVLRAITGWNGVTEADLFNDGDSNEIVDFDKDLFNEVIRDRHDWWVPISARITESIYERQIKKETEIKNSAAGTTNEHLSA